MNKEMTFLQRTRIYASKEIVWNNLLSPQFYKLSWSADLITTWQMNSSIQFTGFWEDSEYIDKGIVLEFEELKLIKFSYWSSFWKVEDVPQEYCYISYYLNAIDKNTCEFTIIQEGFRDEIHYEETIELWKSTCKLLKLLSEKEELTVINNVIFNNLLSILTSISEDVYNKKITDKWNAAQIIEHIIIGNSGMKEFLIKAPFNNDIPYDLNIESIREMMLNKDAKYTSPDFLIPPLKHYNPKKHKELLSSLQVELNNCILTLNLEEKCGTLEMYPYGYLSNYEWLNFSLFHILRHYEQLKSYKELNFMII